MSPLTTKTKILYVEDDAVTCKLVSTFFERQGLQVRTISKGHEAVEMARAWLPDLILMDLMMPEMNGLQVTEALRADPFTQHIPIVAYTVVSEPSVQARARAAGINGFMLKSNPLTEVIKILPTYLP
jgi:CheY-like chemotaxis protein